MREFLKTLHEYPNESGGVAGFFLMVIFMYYLYKLYQD